jgi:hypothetical protein
MKKMMMLFVLLPLLAVGQRKFKGKQPLFTSSQCLNGDCDMGTGTAKNANGDLYYGSWRDGKPHGLGSVYFDPDNESYAPGTFFTGRFAFGLIDGMGTFDFPRERRMTVKFQKSQDFAVFEDVGQLHPRSRRYIMDDVKHWDGWELRQQEFFENGSPDRILVSMYKDWEGTTCWSTTGRSGPVELFFLIDTGCSQTSLTKRTIEYLINNGVRVTKTGSAWFSTACGSREFDEYEIQSITLGGTTFKNLQIGAVEGGDNLLGMDILSAFGTLEFNLEQKTLVLE